MLSRDTAQAQLEELDRRGGQESLYYLAKFVLGYKDMQPQPHVEICRFAEQVAFVPKDSARPNQSGGLDMEPRGVFKTTVFSQALPVFLILQNPNIRILLTSSVLPNSTDNLGVVKRHFEHNQRLRHLFGDYVGELWVTEEMTVAKRTRMDLKEPTVRAASVGKIQVGPHYDVIIADDLVDILNSATPEGRKAVKDYVRLLFSLLEPNGVIYFVGTSYHDDDAYADLRDKEKYPEVERRIRKATSLGGAKGEPYFPTRQPVEFLEAQMRRQGRDIYSAQYDNDPAPEDENSAFKGAWFKGYRADELPEARNTFIFIDPGGESKGADDYVFFLAHCAPPSNLYFDDLLARTMGYEKAVDLCFEWVIRHKPLAVGLETTAQQQYLEQAIRNEMRRRGFYFNLVCFPHAKISKESRIKQLQPRYECGAIYHSSRMGPLEAQLRRFPKGKDDIADAAAGILEVAIAPSVETKEEITFTSLDHYITWKAKQQRDQRNSQRPGHHVLGATW